MVPGDRLLCAFVENRKAADTFKDWPLHITIVPWFRAGVSNKQLSDELNSGLKDVHPFTVNVDGEAKFGYRGRKLVHLIETPSPLEAVEQKARELLHRHDAWIVDETTKIRRPFRPHVTSQKSGGLQGGDTFVCDALYIIEQKGDYKEIMSKINL
jgi:2'-5' RNA ligase